MSGRMSTSTKNRVFNQVEPKERKEKKDGKSSVGVEFDMKKARHDIIKFAMTGLSGTDKHDAETALAITLGAKPPKPTYVNYKELQVRRKKEKEEGLLFRQSYTKPKPMKRLTTDSNTSNTKKHSLETTGIYKVKFPPGSYQNPISKSQTRGKRRHRI